MDLALVGAAEREQTLQFGAVRRLGTLALFLETLENVETFATAVLFAGPELGGQTQVLRLLFGTDADVDDGVPQFAERDAIATACNGVVTVSDEAYFYAGLAFGVTLADPG